MVDIEHGAIIGTGGPANTDGIHVLQNWEFANTAARESETLVTADIGKISLQTDENQWYMAIASGSGASVWRLLIDTEIQVANSAARAAFDVRAVGDIFLQTDIGYLFSSISTGVGAKFIFLNNDDLTIRTYDKTGGTNSSTVTPTVLGSRDLVATNRTWSIKAIGCASVDTSTAVFEIDLRETEADVSILQRPTSVAVSDTDEAFTFTLYGEVTTSSGDSPVKNIELSFIRISGGGNPEMTITDLVIEARLNLDVAPEVTILV